MQVNVCDPGWSREEQTEAVRGDAMRVRVSEERRMTARVRRDLRQIRMLLHRDRTAPTITI